jgi:hypothetical protein
MNLESNGQLVSLAYAQVKCGNGNRCGERAAISHACGVHGHALPRIPVKLGVPSSDPGPRPHGGAWDFALESPQGDRMAKPTITIPLDPETARAYDSATPEEKRKMQALLSLWLRELAAGEPSSIQQVLDEVGRKARARGLTPEILDSLLKGA